MLRPTTIDQYLAAQPADRRALLERVRTAIRRGLGECEEVISYQIPAFRVAGKVTLYFAGWAEHFAIYPLTAGVLERLGPELEAYDQSGRGTLRFPYGGRPPLGLIRRIAELRAAEARAGRSARATKTARGATKEAATPKATSQAAKEAASARKPTSRTTRSAKRARRGSPGGP